MSESVETLGVDLRKQNKQLGAKEKARRRKCDVRSSLIRKNQVFKKNYMRVWFSQERGEDKPWASRQMGAAAGKKGLVSLSLFLEGSDLEVEEELSTMVTQPWAAGTWVGKISREQKELWRRHIFEVQTWRQVREVAGAVMCDTRDLGIKWPQWHSLIFEGHIQVGMRYVCRKDVKKMLLKQARTTYWRKWAAKHEYVKGGVWFHPINDMLRKNIKEEWRDKYRNVLRNIVVEERWVQKRWYDIGLSDGNNCQRCNTKEGTEKH